MNEAKLMGIGPLEFRLQRRVPLELVLASKQQRVLRVPPLHIVVAPHPPAEEIHRQVAALPEERRPLILPWLVEVPFPALRRNRGGEQYKGPQPRQALHKRRRGFGRKMLRRLQGHR